MSIDNLLATHGNADELEAQYTEMVSEAEQSLISLEDVLNSLSEIREDVIASNSICKTQAASMESVCPGILPRTAPVNSFTAIPSATNLKIALEEIDKKKAGIVAAIVIAVGAFLYKLWRWIGGKSDDAPKSFESTAAKIDAVEQADKAAEQAVADLKSKQVNVAELEREVAKDEKVQDNVALISDKYTNVIHLALHSELLPALSGITGDIKTSKFVCKNLTEAVNEYIRKITDQIDTTKPLLENDPDNRLEANIDAVSAAMFAHQKPLNGMFHQELQVIAKIREKFQAIHLPGVQVGHAQVVDGQSDDSMVLRSYVETLQNHKEWLSSFSSALKSDSSKIHEVHGVDEVDKVFLGLEVLKKRTEIVADKLKEIGGLGDVAMIFSEAEVRGRVDKFLTKGDLNKVSELTGYVRDAEKFITTYSQCIATLVNIYATVGNSTNHFIDTLKRYKTSKNKSLAKALSDKVISSLTSEESAKRKELQKIAEALKSDVVET